MYCIAKICHPCCDANTYVIALLVTSHDADRLALFCALLARIVDTALNDLIQSESGWRLSVAQLRVHLTTTDRGMMGERVNHRLLLII